MLGNNNTLNASWQCALFRVLFLKIHNKARLISGFVVFISLIINRLQNICKFSFYFCKTY